MPVFNGTDPCAHATYLPGKNLADVLAQRARTLAAPIQMSDALACNFAGPLGTIVAKCLAYGRRKVVEVVENFPQPCRYIIEVLAQVYAADARAATPRCRPGCACCTIRPTAPSP